MIPVLAIVRVRRRRGRFTLWAPLFLLWLVLAPIALVAGPVLFAASLAARPRLARRAARAIGVLFALAGAEIDVNTPGASVLIRLI